MLGPNFQQKLSLGTPKPIVEPEIETPVVEIQPTDTVETEKESKSSKK